MHQAAVSFLLCGLRTCPYTLICDLHECVQDARRFSWGRQPHGDERKLADIQRKTEISYAPLRSAPRHHRHILSTRVLHQITQIKLSSAKCKVNQHIHQAVMSPSALFSQTTFRQTSEQHKHRDTFNSCSVTFFMLAPTKLLASSLNWGSLQEDEHTNHTVKTNLTGKSTTTVDALSIQQHVTNVYWWLNNVSQCITIRALKYTMDKITSKTTLVLQT